MSGLDLSLEDDDEILATISEDTIQNAKREMERVLGRCESRLASSVSAGKSDQYLKDQARRIEKLKTAIEELVTVEATVRLRKRGSS